VSDELARGVVGNSPSAVGVCDLDALGAIPLLAHRKLARSRATTTRVDRWVLQEEKDVRDVAPLPRLRERSLGLERLAVRNQARPDAPHIGGAHSCRVE